MPPQEIERVISSRCSEGIYHSSLSITFLREKNNKSKKIGSPDSRVSYMYLSVSFLSCPLCECFSNCLCLCITVCCFGCMYVRGDHISNIDSCFVNVVIFL